MAGQEKYILRTALGLACLINRDELGAVGRKFISNEVMSLITVGLYEVGFTVRIQPLLVCLKDVFNQITILIRNGCWDETYVKLDGDAIRDCQFISHIHACILW